jgi:hypothetical protein
MISANSRYKNSSLTTEEVNNKSIIYILPSQPVVEVFQYSYYNVTFADRIDTIAATFLGNPALWYLIAKVNPQIMNFLDLQPGTVLRIPTIATVN